MGGRGALGAMFDGRVETHTQIRAGIAWPLQLTGRNHEVQTDDNLEDGLRSVLGERLVGSGELPAPQTAERGDVRADFGRAGVRIRTNT